MEHKIAYRDSLLGVEALTFDGLSQSFPPHFHPYYVVGLMDGGTRRLTCRGETLTVREGQLLLFNPGDTHSCAQEGHVPLRYRALHIPAERMAALTGGPLPRLCPTAGSPELFDALSLLHRMILSGSSRRAEQWQEAMSRLLDTRTLGVLTETVVRPEVSAACQYLTENLHRRVTLPEVCRQVGVSQSVLLRSFAAEKQVTPHRYLKALRVAEAGQLLRQGVPPAEAAIRAGFADQSHLTNLFRALMGCSPGSYRQEPAKK